MFLPRQWPALLPDIRSLESTSAMFLRLGNSSLLDDPSATAPKVKSQDIERRILPRVHVGGLFVLPRQGIVLGIQSLCSQHHAVVKNTYSLPQLTQLPVCNEPDMAIANSTRPVPSRPNMLVSANIDTCSDAVVRHSWGRCGLVRRS